MKIKVGRSILAKFIILLVSVSLTGCGATQTHYQREYAKVWKKLIQTKAWQESLVADHSNAAQELYASNDAEVILATSKKKETTFEDVYQTLVSKAYSKIITEAEKADARIASEYGQIQDNAFSNKTNKKKMAEITKRYKAHTAMLSGLKSWNIFSEDRSGDLDYFKADHRQEVQKMFRSDKTDEFIINYLIYKLADLYHLE